MSLATRTLLLLALSACAEAAPGDPLDDATTSSKADSVRRAAVRPTGLGAIPYAGGTHFGVWAPNADLVFVSGDFNKWSETATPLTLGAGGVWTVDVTGAHPGQEYLYVITHAGQTLRKIDPRARAVTISVGHAIIVDPKAYAWTTTGYTTPSFDEQVIYEMHIGAFNPTEPGRPGTWASATDKLDDLAALGVNMLEVLPPAEFAGDFSWGYNPAYPDAPESAYGTADDARAFVDAAHARGMGVIIDVVHNHYGPDDLSMWCFDGECYGAGGIYFYTDARGVTPWGSRPDFGRQEVRDYIADSALLWLNEYRADGLRWDSTVNIRNVGADGWQLLQRVNDAVDASQPWKIMIAEDLQGDDWVGKPTAQGGAGFDSQWDPSFFRPIDDNIIKPNDADRSMAAVRDAIARKYNGQATQRVIYTESHDEVANGKQRIPEMIAPGHADSLDARKRSTLGAAIAMTAPGIPMLFMGQEFVENGWFRDSVPLDWTKATTFAGIRQMYADLIQLRRTVPGLRGDSVNVFHVNDTDKVIAYHRWKNGGPGDDVVIIANFSARAFPSYEIGFPRGGTWHGRFNGDWTGYASDFGNTPANDTTAWSGGKDGLSYHGTVGVGAYSVTILMQ
jgi:1,4-alpha-glucan branching enzyme